MGTFSTHYKPGLEPGTTISGCFALLSYKCVAKISKICNTTENTCYFFYFFISSNLINPKHNKACKTLSAEA